MTTTDVALAEQLKASDVGLQFLTGELLPVSRSGAALAWACGPAHSCAGQGRRGEAARDCWWISVISPVSQACRTDRADNGRVSH